MSTSRRLLAAFCALTLATGGVLVAPAARAQISASDKETARALMKDGDAKRAKGDHKGAYEAYKAAHAIMNVPTTGLEMGREQERLGMLVEARDTLLSVTRLPVMPGESANMALARDEAQKIADVIEPRIASLKIVLDKLPSGATPKVTVDGTPILVATLGVPRKHNPGPHEIVVVVGTVEKKTEVDLAEGETKEVSIDVSPTEAPKEAAKPDPHDAPPPEEPPPPPPPPGRSSLVWIGFGTAAAMGVVGAVTGVFAFTTASSAKDRCEGTRCPPAVHDDIESSRTYGTISTISFAVAGAGAIVGVIGLYTSPKATPTEPAAGSLGLLIGANGFALRGSF